MLRKKLFKLFKFMFVFMLLTSAQKGWLWYEEDNIAPKETKPLQQEANKITRASKAEVRNNLLKQELDDAMQIALNDPTLQNVTKAQRLQKKVMDRSSDFADMWSLASLLDLHTNNNNQNPNVIHQQIAKQEKHENFSFELNKMSQNFGLVLYVIESCLYCQKFAPIVKKLQDETNFQVLAISKEGKAYGPFLGAKDVSGIMAYLNPQNFAPILYLVSKDSKQIVPVARGLTDLEQLKENIMQVRKILK